MLTEVQVEALVQKLEDKRVGSQTFDNPLINGMIDIVIHYLNLVLEK